VLNVWIGPSGAMTFSRLTLNRMTEIRVEIFGLFAVLLTVTNIIILSVTLLSVIRLNDAARSGGVTAKFFISRSCRGTVLVDQKTGST
jgi:hypothetical protein